MLILTEGKPLELEVVSVLRDEQGKIWGFGFQDKRSTADYSVYYVSDKK